MRFGTLVALAFALTACRDANPVSRHFSLSLQPGSIDFGQVARGERVQAGLTVQNTSTFDMFLALRAESPVGLSSETLTLAAGEARSVEVSFASMDLGSASGEVQVEAESLHLVVPWKATVVEPVDCPTPSPCHAAALDAAGSCIEVAANDGMSCSLAPGSCASDGRCLSGVCTPQVLSCDDGNACTSDECVSPNGCVHVDQTPLCPGSSNPCLVPSCDPSTGCTLVPLPDGSVCGSFDCSEHHICRAGACVSEPAEDGDVCGEVSPCHPRGTCQDHVCNQPPPATLTVLWKHELAADRTQVVDKVAFDREGRSFWLETGLDGAYWLLSASPTGELLFDRNIGIEDSPCRIFLLGQGEEEKIIVSYCDNARIDVRSPKDGTVVGSVDLRGTPVYSANAETGGAAVVGSGNNVYVVANKYSLGDPPVPLPSALVAIDLSKMAVHAVGTSTLQVLKPFTDDSGNLYLEAYWQWFNSVVSFDSDMNERFRLALPMPGNGDGAVFNHRIYVADWVFDDDGGLVRTMTTSTPRQNPLAAVEGTRYSLYLVDGSWTKARVMRADPGSGDLLWTRYLPHEVNYPHARPIFVSRDDQMLVFTSDFVDGQSHYFVDGFNKLGEAWTCEIPSRWGGLNVVGDEMFLTTDYEGITAYSLPGFSAGWDGWSSSTGDPSQSESWW